MTSTTPVRVLITGSRAFTNRAVIAGAINRVARENPGRQLTIVEGCAKGADSLAGAVARKYPGRLVDEPHPVLNWENADGSKNWRAGFDRNQEMVDTGADVCLAFLQRGAENNGTRDCIGRAVIAGIPVRINWSDDDQ